ncbi:MAG: hypothetical protein JNK02_13155 [Planctomycetes bacterium]|nr:hypothetical protein [Planctomycetota bacterium]
MNAAFLLAGRLPQASSYAESVDRSLLLAGWFAAFCAVLVAGGLALALLGPRAASADASLASAAGPRRRVRLAGAVAGVFFAIVVIHGAVVWADVRTAPRGALPIRVGVEGGAFRFTYPSGHEDVALHLPLERPVRLILAGADEPYSFAIPEFRLQVTVTMRTPAEAWVEALVPGEYAARSLRRPGLALSTADVVVHEAGGFETWLRGVSGPPLDLPPVELGRRSYEMRGCTQCHALDGTRLVGPGFGAFFARQRELADGTRLDVTDEYVRESVLDPQAKVVAGFEPVMPSFRGRLHELEVEGLIAFLRSLE